MYLQGLCMYKMESESVYDDLPAYDLGSNVEKLVHENKYLQEHILSLEADSQKFCTRINDMKQTQSNLERNISELFKTAKIEIERKDRTIASLRKDLEDYHKKVRILTSKRNTENSPGNGLDKNLMMKKIKLDESKYSSSGSEKDMNRKQMKIRESSPDKDLNRKKLKYDDYKHYKSDNYDDYIKHHKSDNQGVRRRSRSRSRGRERHRKEPKDYKDRSRSRPKTTYDDAERKSHIRMKEKHPCPEPSAMKTAPKEEAKKKPVTTESSLSENTKKKTTNIEPVDLGKDPETTLDKKPSTMKSVRKEATEEAKKKHVTTEPTLSENIKKKSTNIEPVHLSKDSETTKDKKPPTTKTESKEATQETKKKPVTTESENSKKKSTNIESVDLRKDSETKPESSQLPDDTKKKSAVKLDKKINAATESSQKTDPAPNVETKVESSLQKGDEKQTEQINKNAETKKSVKLETIKKSKTGKTKKEEVTKKLFETNEVPDPPENVKYSLVEIDNSNTQNTQSKIKILDSMIIKSADADKIIINKTCDQVTRSNPIKPRIASDSKCVKGQFLEAEFNRDKELTVKTNLQSTNKCEPKTNIKGADKGKDTEKKVKSRRESVTGNTPPESGRVLRSATRKNTEKPKENVSNNSASNEKTTSHSGESSEIGIKADSQKLKIGEIVCVNLSHEGAIPELHISEIDTSTTNNNSLFELQDATPAKALTASTPVCDRSVNIEMLKEDLNISSLEAFDSHDEKTDSSFKNSNAAEQVKAENTSANNTFISSNSWLGSQPLSSCKRKRRRCIITMID